MVIWLSDWMRHILLLTLLVFAACTYAEPETHLIPEGYAGPVYIVQAWPEGEPEQYEGSRRLYQIPSDGLLLTKFGSNDGIIDNRYYFVGSDSERREIAGRSYSSVNNIPESVADTTVLIQGPRVGKMGATQVPYEMYLVGTKADLLNWDHDVHGDVFDALERRGITIK